MLKKLKIQNLVLVERAEISFGPHLNVLTGETGAGKSAILSAIQLISGARADAELIRNGTEIAVVEAEIVQGEETLFIRREIHKSGKSRSFVDDTQISLSGLKELVGKSIELVDQSSAQTLCKEETQRTLLDTFSDLMEKGSLFKESFEEEKRDKERWIELNSEDKKKQLEWAQKDLEWIEKANWQKEEETNLNQEHHLLLHAQELKEKTGSSALALHEIYPLLKRQIQNLDGALRLDPKLEPMVASIRSANIELQEAARSLDSYTDQIEDDPARLMAIEERIGAIETVKRRFGENWDLVEEKKNGLQKEIESLLCRDEELLKLKTKIDRLSQQNVQFAKEISEQRQEKATILSQLITKELKSLNLPHAQFSIEIKPKPLSSSGSDQIEFLFSANLGVAPISIDACASGGELSRLLLAIKIVVADKEKRSCLIFDEIDSNVGGQTATILGEKLKKLAENSQVICVTHFVQVAKCAQDHFGVFKQQERGSSLTSIEKLSSLKRDDEYTRMLGLNL